MPKKHKGFQPPDPYTNICTCRSSGTCDACLSWSQNYREVCDDLRRYGRKRLPPSPVRDAFGNVIKTTKQPAELIRTIDLINTILGKTRWELPATDIEAMSRTVKILKGFCHEGAGIPAHVGEAS